MKKTRLFAVMSSFAVIFAVSCTKETPSGVEGTPAEPGFKTVTLKTGVETKINSNGDVLRWNTAEEKLAVYGQIGDQMIQYKFTKPQVEGVSTPTEAEFSGTVSENAVLKYASYPYSETNSACSTDGKLTMELDNTLSYNATNSVAAETPLFGIISDNSLTMKSACAYLKITLPGVVGSNDIYESITVEAEDCCGAFVVDCSGETPEISKGDMDKIVCTARRNRPGIYYVPILPGTYDNMTITVKYTTESGYPDFVKQSESSNTFVRGNYYDCHELSGAFAQSVTTGDGAIEGTTLSMDAAAVIWKCSEDVTNDSYTAKFFYAEAGVEKGAEGWTEVEAEISGKTSEVTLAASAPVEAGKAYQFYAQVSDGINTVDGAIVTVTARVKTNVEFVPNGRDGEFVYLDPTEGYKMVTDQDGNPVFPTFGPSGKKATYYYKEYKNGVYSDVQNVQGADGNPAPAYILGATITKTEGNESFAIQLNNTDTYYTYSSSLFCCNSGFNIKLLCPSGYTITKVALKVAAGKTCKWGVGSTGSSADLIPEQDYKDASKAVNVELPIPAAVQDTPYYLISKSVNNRLGSIVVTYEK